MTEPETMTDEQARKLLIASWVGTIVSDEQERMFERFDGLHKKGVTDTQVVHALRHNGDNRLAEDYIEWADIADPDADGAPRGIVIDDVNASSYIPMIAEHKEFLDQKAANEQAIKEAESPIPIEWIRHTPTDMGGGRVEVLTETSSGHKFVRIGHYPPTFTPEGDTYNA